MDLGNDNVVQYTLDTDTGVLTHLSDVHMGAESGPRGIVFHPEHRIAYVNCELGGTVVACSIDDAAGLTANQTVKVYPADFVGDDHPDNFGKASYWTAEALLSADARFLYTICRIHHSISILPVNADGSLDEAGMTRFGTYTQSPFSLREIERNSTLLALPRSVADGVRGGRPAPGFERPELHARGQLHSRREPGKWSSPLFLFSSPPVSPTPHNLTYSS